MPVQTNILPRQPPLLSTIEPEGQVCKLKAVQIYSESQQEPHLSCSLHTFKFPTASPSFSFDFAALILNLFQTWANRRAAGGAWTVQRWKKKTNSI